MSTLKYHNRHISMTTNAPLAHNSKEQRLA